MKVETKTIICETKKITVKTNALSCALNLAEEAFDKILAVTATVSSGECEIAGEEIVYGGTANFNAIFSAEEPNRVEAGVKFTFKIPLEAGVTNASATYNISDIKVKSDGGMLFAVCDLISSLELIVREEKESVSDGECLTQKETVSTLSRFLVKKEVTVDDEFTVRRVKRALLGEANACITDLKAEEDYVIVDGEVVLNVCLLPFSENSDILKETRIIPFRFEVDAEGSGEGDRLCGRAQVIKVALKIEIDEESDKATVFAAVNVDLCIEDHRPDRFSYIVDAFSKTHELILKREPIERLTGVTRSVENVRYNGKALKKAPEYSRLIKIVGERIEGYSARNEKGSLSVDGELSAYALFADSDNAISSEKLVVPFSFTVSGDGDAEIFLESLNAKLRSGDIECDANFKVVLTRTEKTVVDTVVSIEEGAERPVRDSAISVYLGKTGDSEWTVVKALGEDAETIAALNPDVSYPLSGGERIVVFRKIQA